MDQLLPLLSKRDERFNWSQESRQRVIIVDDKARKERIVDVYQTM